MPSLALCFYIPLTGTGHPILKTRSVEARVMRRTLQRVFYELSENMLRVYINLKQLSTEKLNKKGCGSKSTALGLNCEELRTNPNRRQRLLPSWSDPTSPYQLQSWSSMITCLQLFYGPFREVLDHTGRKE